MAFCTKQKEVLDLIESNIVDQTGPGCNLLLAELSRLSKIVEQSSRSKRAMGVRGNIHQQQCLSNNTIESWPHHGCSSMTVTA